MAPLHPETKSSFVGDWRPADLKYARDLMRRGLLDPHRISWRDPTCQECGHRAWDHGLANLPIQDQIRWFREEPTACQWKGCACTVWRPEMYAKHPGEYTGQVRVTDAWVEVPLGRSWVVAYRIVNDRGRPVVGEIRIFPAEENRPRLGHWSGELLGTTAKVPRRGITSRQLRDVRVRAYLQYMAGRVADFQARLGDMAEHWGWGAAKSNIPNRVRSTGARRGRKPRPDKFYARIAADYVQALSSGSKRPIQDVAKRRKLPGGQVRDMIRQARKRGLLTRERGGVRGGMLTASGSALVPARKPKRPIKPKSPRFMADIGLGPGGTDVVTTGERVHVKAAAPN